MLTQTLRVGRRFFLISACTGSSGSSTGIEGCRCEVDMTFCHYISNIHIWYSILIHWLSNCKYIISTHYDWNWSGIVRTNWIPTLKEVYLYHISCAKHLIQCPVHLQDITLIPLYFDPNSLQFIYTHLKKRYVNHRSIKQKYFFRIQVFLT